MQRYFLFFILLLANVSCITRRNTAYFHHDKHKGSDSLEFVYSVNSQYQLKTGDILYIKINGIDSKTSSYFNIDGDGKYATFNDAYLYINSYTIDESGEVTLPVLGSLKIKSLTPIQVVDTLKSLLEQQLSKPSIQVKLISFNISVLGEVNKPGTFPIYDDKITLAKALGLAGDLTEFGNRKRVKVIRQNSKLPGIYYVDLTNESTLYSQEFYLQPGDFIYVEPVKMKLLSTNLAPLRTILLGGSLFILILRLYQYL